jgi:hypothetical protein
VEGSSEEGAAEESGGTEPSSELTASDEFTAESSVLEEGVEDEISDTVWLFSLPPPADSPEGQNCRKRRLIPNTIKNAATRTIEVRMITGRLLLRYFFLVCNTFLAIQCQLPYVQFIRIFYFLL